MTDYKKMYLTMVKETERAINILIESQRQCEELYINSTEPETTILDTKTEQIE